MTQDVAQDPQKLQDTVRTIVAEELEVEPEELVETASFEEEYDADSLALLAIVARFENELGITIAPDRVGEMTSLESVVKVVEEHRESSANA